MNASTDILARSNARTRLAKYRARVVRALESIAKHHPNAHPDCVARESDWRNARRGWLGSAHGLSLHAREAGDRGRRDAYVSAPWELVDGWRDAGDVADIARREGWYGRDWDAAWYSDAHRCNTYVPHVWQLPARDGTPQYVAGYVENESGLGSGIDARRATGYVVLSLTCDGRALELHNTLRDAARDAMSLAERNAERERDESERYDEAFRTSDKRDSERDSVRASRRAVHEAARALRVARETGDGDTLAPFARRVIADERARVARSVERIRTLTKELRTLAHDDFPA